MTFFEERYAVVVMYTKSIDNVNKFKSNNNFQDEPQKKSSAQIDLFFMVIIGFEVSIQLLIDLGEIENNVSFA